MSDVSSLAAAGMVSAPTERNASAPSSTLSRLLPGALLLLGLMCVVPAVYFPYITHNLPVSGNVDERTSLAVLERFHHGSLNPLFFMYPTLYYYVTYLFVALVDSSKILILGRGLNLAFVGLTAFLSYRFCADHLRSRAAGVIAALCVVGSTTITNSGAYLCTDVLLAATTLATLHALTTYFETDAPRPWWIGMVLLGAAVGCKYTAFLLFIAYSIAEVIIDLRVRSRRAVDTGGGRFGRSPLAAVLAGFAVVFLAAAVFFPVATVLQFVAHTRSNVDLKTSSDYLVFFGHLRHALGAVGALMGVLAGLVLWVRPVYACVSRKRLYGALAIVVLVAYLSTPYSLLDPKHFVYDLGALAHSNIVVAGSHAQWANYFGWLMSNENPALLLLSVAGIIVVARRANRSFLLLGVYLLLYVYVIGSAHLGFPRYLTPLLPLLYCATGSALVSLWRRNSSTPWPKVATATLCLLVAVEEVSRGIQREQLARDTDALYASYQVARQQAPGAVLYAGYAPNVELEESGLHTQPVSWASLAEHGRAALLECGQLLIFDKRAAALHHVEATGSAELTILLDDPRGYGQEVLSRSDCH